MYTSPPTTTKTHLRELDGRRTTSGFTLIEMLVVIGVIALIVGAMAPMVFSSLAAGRLSATGETMVSQMNFARQRAVSSNQEVELRFFIYDDPELSGTTPLYSAMGIFSVAQQVSASGILTTSSQQIGDIFYLPGGIAIGATNELSPILVDAKRPLSKDSEKAIAKASANYKSVKFSPAGTTDLSPAASSDYISLVEEKYADAKGDVPKNFFAIQIDPANGRIQTYRP